MIELDRVYVGPSRAKTEDIIPDRVVIEILEELGININTATTADKNRMFEAYKQRSRADLELADTNALHIADYVWQRLTGRSIRSRPKIVSAKVLKAKSERQEKIIEAIKAFCVMDCILPSGKQLRYASGAECKAAGGLFNRIAAKVKPNQIVGEVLTDKQAQALWPAK